MHPNFRSMHSDTPIKVYKDLIWHQIFHSPSDLLDQSIQVVEQFM